MTLLLILFLVSNSVAFDESGWDYSFSDPDEHSLNFLGATPRYHFDDGILYMNEGDLNYQHTHLGEPMENLLGDINLGIEDKEPFIMKIKEKQWWRLTDPVKKRRDEVHKISGSTSFGTKLDCLVVKTFAFLFAKDGTSNFGLRWNANSGSIHLVRGKDFDQTLGGSIAKVPAGKTFQWSLRLRCRYPCTSQQLRATVNGKRKTIWLRLSPKTLLKYGFGVIEEPEDRKKRALMDSSSLYSKKRSIIADCQVRHMNINPYHRGRSIGPPPAPPTSPKFIKGGAGDQVVTTMIHAFAQESSSNTEESSNTEGKSDSNRNLIIAIVVLNVILGIALFGLILFVVVKKIT